MNRDKVVILGYTKSTPAEALNDSLRTADCIFLYYIDFNEVRNNVAFDFALPGSSPLVT